MNVRLRTTELCISIVTNGNQYMDVYNPSTVTISNVKFKIHC